MNTPGEDQADGRPGAAWRARVEADLAAYAAEQQRLYGGIDELTLARYEAGLGTAAERARVEQALRDHPALRECLDLSRELAEEWQAADSTSVPDFDPATIRMDSEGRSLPVPHPPKPWLRWLAVAAAVVALVGLGILVRSARRQGTPPEIVKEPSLSPTDKAKASADGGLAFPPPRRHPVPEGIAKTPEIKPPPPMSEDATLLARIAAYGGKPLNVSDAKVRVLREAVVRYQQQHSEPRIPEMEAFVAASEPTARNELLYAEARADELKDAPNDAPDVRELRGTILTLRLRDDTRPLILQSKPLAGFMNRKPADDPAAKAAEMKSEVLALTARFPQAKERGPYLLCVLPPGIRGEAVDVYKEIQTYARSPGSEPDATLLDYITRARRPIPQDTLGMIIPMFIYPDKDKPGPWNQVLALGNQGVRIKVVIAHSFNNAQEADPNYLTVIDLAHQHGIEVLGRVGCPGGQEGLAVAQREVMLWHQLYTNRLDGLFFGDQSTEIALVKPYATLYRYARGLEGRWQIVACPGSPCAEAFLTETGADILCPSTSPGGPHTKGWEAKYDPERFAAIIYDVVDETLVPGFLMNAVEKHFGWVCVEGKDAYITKPPYLGTELRWIQDINQRILNGNAPAPLRRTTPKAAPAKTKARK